MRWWDYSACCSRSPHDQNVRARRAHAGRSVPLLLYLAAGSTLLICGSLFAQGPAQVDVGKFSTAAEGTEFPDNWKPLTFKKVKRQTSYALVREGGIMVVKATSEAASSGLTREIRIDPMQYPIVQWRWKAGSLIQKSDVTRQDGDDYAARLYVTFEYDSAKVGLLERAKYEALRLLYGKYPPLGALNYIWATRESKGAIVPNPYTDRAMMVVVESGGDQLNTWVTEERNIAADYRQAFGTNPPLISGEAIMTDTDDTKESATAYYGDIVFKQASK